MADDAPLADGSVGDAEVEKTKRQLRNFPSLPYSDCEAFAAQIYQLGSGNPVRRMTIFSELGRSPDSSASRTLITTAGKYGLTKGSYKADFIELTDLGRKCVADGIGSAERVAARFSAAIELITPFNRLYEQNINLKRPSNSVLADAIQAFAVTKETSEEAVETFIVNLKFVGLLKNISGAERILPLQHVIEDFQQGNSGKLDGPTTVSHPALPQVTELGVFEKTCFYVTPIGADGSDQRRHSDLFLSYLVEPAIKSLDLTVVRADRIQKAGSITRQILEYLLKSKLVIVDLSFHNPNVFYELAIRHVTRKPVVQIIRKGDGIPFDISNIRTIEIDNSSLYEFVPMIETYRAEISSHARAALDDADITDNPMATYFPEVGMSGI